jgi:hypothetical protein
MSCRKLGAPVALEHPADGLVRPDGAWEIYRAMLAAGRRLGRVRRDQFG